MPRYKLINGESIQLTAEEETARNIEEQEWNNASATRKLVDIKEIRLEKLIETDYLANSDVTMPENIKTWRQSLRDIPQDYSEEQYSDLLARDEQGNLTHSVWSKP